PVCAIEKPIVIGCPLGAVGAGPCAQVAAGASSRNAAARRFIVHIEGRLRNMIPPRVIAAHGATHISMSATKPAMVRGAPHLSPSPIRASAPLERASERLM